MDWAITTPTSTNTQVKQNQSQTQKVDQENQLLQWTSEQSAYAPYWGVPTSTIDWCEENYTRNGFIAEFWNSVSNMLMIYLSLFGLVQALINNRHRSQSAAFQRSQQPLEWKPERRFILAYLAFLTVGIGSTAFHGTLTYEAQLLDELPMIYGTCIFVYCVLQSRKKPTYKWLTPILVCYALGVTFVYLRWRHPLFHQIAYAFLVVIINIGFVFNILYLRSLIKFRLKRLDNERERKSIAPHIVAIRFFCVSLLSYIAGFAAWNVDNQFCEEIRSLRHGLLMMAVSATGGDPSGLATFATEVLVLPWLQLHAMWHVLTGTASYLFIVLSEYVRAILLQLEDQLDHQNQLTGGNINRSNPSYHASLGFYLGFIPYVQYDHDHSA